jgi:hypothetical protein
MDLTRIKLALALMAAIVFGYGVRVDSENVRWVGAALLVVALLLRFFRPRAPE